MQLKKPLIIMCSLFIVGTLTACEDPSSSNSRDGDVRSIIQDSVSPLDTSDNSNSHNLSNACAGFEVSNDLNVPPTNRLGSITTFTCPIND